MSITPATSTPSSAQTRAVVGSSPTTTMPATTASSMGLDASSFMQLFTTQLANQDPMSPMDSSAFLNQFAQITSVQTLNELQTTLTGLTSTMNQMQSSTATANATGLIGRTVGYTDSSGAAQQQQVNAINIDSTGNVNLVLASGVSLPASSVQQVK